MISVSNLRMFAWLTPALLCAGLLLFGTAQAQQSSRSPYDGMSAIDIMVAAASRDQEDKSTVAQSPPEGASSSSSSLSFLDFHFVELTGRYQHEGWYPIPGQPLPGNATGLARVHGSWHSFQFRLITEAGELIEPVVLDFLAGDQFVGGFEIPDQPFKVAASGLDESDQAFDLIWPEVFRPRALELRFDSPFGTHQPGLVSLPLTITNYGVADSFQLSAEDDMGLGVSLTDTEIVIGQGQSGSTSVELIVPAISVGLLDIKITATAAGSSGPDSSNSASTLVRTERFNLILNSGFEARQASQ